MDKRPGAACFGGDGRRAEEDDEAAGPDHGTKAPGLDGADADAPEVRDTAPALAGLTRLGCAAGRCEKPDGELEASRCFGLLHPDKSALDGSLATALEPEAPPPVPAQSQ